MRSAHACLSTKYGWQGAMRGNLRPPRAPEALAEEQISLKIHYHSTGKLTLDKPLALLALLAAAVGFSAAPLFLQLSTRECGFGIFLFLLMESTSFFCSELYPNIRYA